MLFAHSAGLSAKPFSRSTATGKSLAATIA
jgi:hypothetical protein